MSQPSGDGTNPGKRLTILERVASFSTTAAFALVAVWMDQPVFFVSAAFAAVAAIADLFARRYPREARIARWVGRIGMIASILYVAFLLFRD